MNKKLLTNVLLGASSILIINNAVASAAYDGDLNNGEHLVIINNTNKDLTAYAMANTGKFECLRSEGSKTKFQSPTFRETIITDTAGHQVDTQTFKIAKGHSVVYTIPQSGLNKCYLADEDDGDLFGITDVDLTVPVDDSAPSIAIVHHINLVNVNAQHKIYLNLDTGANGGGFKPGGLDPFNNAYYVTNATSVQGNNMIIISENMLAHKSKKQPHAGLFPMVK